MTQENKKKAIINNKTIKVHEEELNITKKDVETGKVNIHKKVDTENFSEKIPLATENFIIKHIDFNKEVKKTPKIREKGNITIIPVVKEVAVITKKLMLIEEIHIIKVRTVTNKIIKTTLRKEKIIINKED
ncbi:YsnF/AvaK domain-containing protein [Aequorivita lipolytica]|jgi:uncharacterized protein (TIGR02271 family)|uniref:DUF2382 domain-containing protein n=1 Tax=Aequorivita lipolytica TaxID=153267 RepID=A0A5C6YTN3_9FLAO|nr:YsnF/AvaK domain-containing protein [Aequorivita lipolytica]TXD70842.1 DUF2382 domain-containing protein [Aequorivita lipolytica]SRX49893.1 Stress response protein YsnF [Aequorivita lipolytica]